MNAKTNGRAARPIQTGLARTKSVSMIFTNMEGKVDGVEEQKESHANGHRSM
jgi:hypothetical protein